jgi:hypothetical protein
MADRVDIRRLALALSLLIATKGGKGFAAPASLQYNRDVRPILSENCFACHGPDSAARKARLRLDRFEDATARSAEGGAAIVPGNPDRSGAIQRIFDPGDDLMPPEKSHKVLAPAQKELLKRWVAEGANYQPHWSLIAPQRPEPPPVRDRKWARNAVDRFILARLEPEKLKPAPEADLRALARRASLDLTGLPPKPEAVEAFVNDASPDAYGKFVDRLLASPQWGEHRARYWLDAARYADTHGIHFDNFREVWAYRDWVINAFNANVPFDRFTIEQLAGDLLPGATLDQQIASGFNRCNITSNEGGLIEEEYLVLYARDRTETTSQVWLGLTAGCAVCHEHKYDPLSQKEFYQMSAFFNNTTQKAMDGNVKDTAPVVIVPARGERVRWVELARETADARQRFEERKQSARAGFDAWLTRPDLAALNALSPPGQAVFHAPLDEGAGGTLTVEVAGQARAVPSGTNALWQDGAVSAKAWFVSDQSPAGFADVGDFERDQKFSYAVWVKPAPDRNGSVFARMTDGPGQRGWDLFLDGRKPAVHLLHAWPRDALRVVAKTELAKDQWNHVAVTYDGSSKAAGLKIYINGEAQPVKVDKDTLTGSTRTNAPFTLGQRTGGPRLDNTGVQDLRIFDRELSPAEIRALAEIPRLRWLAAKPAETRAKEESEELYRLWLGQVDEPHQKIVVERERLQREHDGILARGTVAHVMSESTNAPEAYFLYRGEYDKRRDRVTPATPAALPPMPDDLPRNRLGFAQWLLRPEHPLTARVTVNRFWQEVFGAGLVRTPGDFGVAGETPSHPELLDWLAVEFRESGWDMKRFFKLLVTSATYRQSAAVTPEKLAKDPQNRLLARGPRFRMDAEMVRDHALAASGLLVETLGGPSVKPYQPEGVWEAVAMPESNTRSYKRDSGQGLHRRSLYTFWKRSAPPAQMDIFNAPSREQCAVRRERTDTPLQALVTLNDPQFVEAARNLAERALRDAGEQDAARLDFMAARLIARPLRAAERKIVRGGLKELLEHYRRTPADAAALIAVGETRADARLDAPTLAAYTMVANQLMNLDEVLNK